MTEEGTYSIRRSIVSLLLSSCGTGQTHTAHQTYWTLCTFGFSFASPNLLCIVCGMCLRSHHKVYYIDHSHTHTNPFTAMQTLHRRNSSESRIRNTTCCQHTTYIGLVSLDFDFNFLVVSMNKCAIHCLVHCMRAPESIQSIECGQLMKSN